MTMTGQAILPRFLVVGGCGFLLDAGIFQALVSADVGPIGARVVSAAAAITLTWYLNRRHVFRTHGVNRHGPEYLRYLSVQTFGLVINFGTFLILVTRVEAFRAMPLLALCAGAGLAIAFNFLGARYWAYRVHG